MSVTPDITDAISYLREVIVKEEMALHGRLEQLKAYRDEAHSDETYDDITEQMRQAHRESYASIEPVRRQLDHLVRAVATLRQFDAPIIISSKSPQA